MLGDLIRSLKGETKAPPAIEAEPDPAPEPTVYFEPLFDWPIYGRNGSIVGVLQVDSLRLGRLVTAKCHALAIAYHLEAPVDDVLIALGEVELTRPQLFDRPCGLTVAAHLVALRLGLEDAPPYHPVIL